MANGVRNYGLACKTRNVGLKPYSIATLEDGTRVELASYPIRDADGWYSIFARDIDQPNINRRYAVLPEALDLD